MIRRLDQRGTASWEFCLVAVPFFTLLFVIFDLGRYAITVQSLHALANAGARAAIINCYQGQVVAHQSPVGCTTDYLTSTDKQNAAPFLYSNGSSAPTLTIAAGANSLTVTASQTFAMIMPIWAGSLDNPSVTTAIPF